MRALAGFLLIPILFNYLARGEEQRNTKFKINNLINEKYSSDARESLDEDSLLWAHQSDVEKKVPLHAFISPTPVPVFNVSLDDPPSTRWNHVMKHYLYVVDFIKIILEEEFPKPLIPLIEEIAKGLDNYVPTVYAQEMKGLAEFTGAKLSDIVILNIFYDLTAYCTSIVVQDDRNQIWHARNLDFGFTDMMRNTTITINFIQNNTIAYKGTGSAGLIGLFSAMKPKAFTLTLNERDQGALWENALMAILDRKAQFASFLVRDLVWHEQNYDSALGVAKAADTIAEFYLIVGGVGFAEGAVITKKHRGSADIWTLDIHGGRWFLVETNYDHWKPPPKDDDRRTPANKAMNETGRSNINAQTLMQVLSVAPVLNPTTAYTLVMSAAQPDIYQAYVRHI